MKKPITVIKKQRKVGSFTFDATYFEQHTAEIEITEQPIEFGAQSQDHAYVKPLTLTISAGVADTPLLPNPSFDSSTSSARSSSAYQKLLTAQNNRQLLDVQTGLANYSNMLIKSINTVQDVKTPDIFNFIMVLEQLMIVNVQNVNVPTEFLKPGPTADLASPVKTNGNQQPLPLPLSQKQISTLQGIFKFK